MADSEVKRDPVALVVVGMTAVLGLVALLLSIFVTRVEHIDLEHRVTRLEDRVIPVAATAPAAPTYKIRTH